MPPAARLAPTAGALDSHEARLAGLRLVGPHGLTTKAYALRFQMSYAQARYFVLNDGVVGRRGPQPFFTPEEEAVLAKFLVINATIGRGLSVDALCRVCSLYLSELSAERQVAARKLFNGSFTPGRSWVRGFLGRHPELKKYRVGNLEEGRGRNSRPDVVASWYAILTLMYREYNIVSPRQVRNMDETYIHARTWALTGRSEIIGGVGMTKPEVILPPFASGAGACTAAFCVSAAGVVAPHFIVVDGRVAGHGTVALTYQDGRKEYEALAAYLNEGAVVWRRSPPGFDIALDVWAEVFAQFACSYFPEEAKIFSIDGAKVHLSSAGLLTLLRANVHVVEEPSQMSHTLQALDNKSAFGRYKPELRSRLREIALECRDGGHPFNAPDLMRCIAGAESDALTADALKMAFRRVGMWPLDPTVVSLETLSKGTDAPVTGINLELLTKRLIPAVRKDMSCPRIVNGTLSTAGRGTVLTAPKILGALEREVASKKAAKTVKAAGTRAREAKAQGKKLKAAEAARAKRAKAQAAEAAKRTKLQIEQEAKRREAWSQLALEAAREGGCRLRAAGMIGPSAAKIRHRAVAARARGASAMLPMPLQDRWRLVVDQAAQVGGRRPQ